jgi:hypothetical protein
MDVTEFVRAHPDGNLSFVLIREKRFDGDADASQVQITTHDPNPGNPTAPQLTLYNSAVPTFYWAKQLGGQSFSAAANWDIATSAPSAAGDIAVLATTSPARKR